MAKSQAEKQQEYNTLKSQNYNRALSINNTKSQIDSIDSKIRRLDNAYNKIGEFKNAAKTIRNNEKGNVFTFGVSNTSSYWKGQNYDKYSKYNTALDSDHITYINQIDRAQDLINDERRRLKNMRAEKAGILKGLIEAYNYVENKIQNFFN